jgi:hypothetical protein
MNQTIKTYNNTQTVSDTAICDLLAATIDAVLKETESNTDVKNNIVQSSQTRLNYLFSAYTNVRFKFY